MNLKKILAGVLACCVMGGNLPSVVKTADNSVITASADYTEGTYESLTYKNYGDYIEISGCNVSATEIVIPDKIDGLPVTSIGNWSISNYKLTSITIPNSVTSIYNGAFNACDSLAAINVSDNNKFYSDIDGVLLNKDKTEILSYPNGKSETYTIPDIVTSIGDKAFSRCYNLTSIIIPDSVTNIGNGAFNACDSLTAINVSDNNKFYSDIDGVLFNKDKSEIHSYPDGKTKTYTIPDSVTSINDYAFSCSKLTSINIPNSVTSIGDWSFSCSKLTSITIPDSVTNISDYTFFGCESLTSITIPDTVTSIGYEAFCACYSLISITIPDSVTSIDSETFSYCITLTSITILNPSCKIYNNRGTISDTAKIYGYENSTAQAYAEKYNRKFVSLGEAPTTELTVKLYGDANDNGKLEIADAVLIMQAIANKDAFGVGGTDTYAITPQGNLNADCYLPGSDLTGMDSLAVQRKLVNLCELPVLSADN